MSLLILPIGIIMIKIRSKRNITPERAVELLAEHGTIVIKDRQAISSTLSTDQPHNDDDIISIKKMLEEILKTNEIIQLDVDFIKSRYTKSSASTKKKISREQQISELKNKILTRGKKKI